MIDIACADVLFSVPKCMELRTWQVKPWEWSTKGAQQFADSRHPRNAFSLTMGI